MWPRLTWFFVCVSDYQKWQFGFQNKLFQILVIVIGRGWRLLFALSLALLWDCPLNSCVILVLAFLFLILCMLYSPVKFCKPFGTFCYFQETLI